MPRFGFLGIAVLLALPLGAAAQQDETLADIRQELTVLHVEMQKLKRELSTTGNAGMIGSGGTVLERMDAMEAELQRLTGKTEQLENTINRVVSDGTNRIGDLEFRLVELEGGDPSKLGQTSTLGGGAAPAVTGGGATGNTTAGTSVIETAPVDGAALPPLDGSGGELAMNERTDFKRAQEVLASGDFRSAAEQFATFGQTYPGSPLEAQALLLRGEALEGAGDITAAARSYLESFSGAPNGETAPRALVKLGAALGRLGQTAEACVTLGEVALRFPQDSAISDADAAMRNLGCS